MSAAAFTPARARWTRVSRKRSFAASDCRCVRIAYFPEAPPFADACRETLAAFGDRVVVKPLRQGSAIGVTPVMNGGDLTKPFEKAFALGDGVLVEPFVLGIEVTVGVLDLHGTVGARVSDDRSAHAARHLVRLRAPLHGRPERTRDSGAGQRPLSEPFAGDRDGGARVLGCADLSRADFIVTDAEEIVLLEVNTLPGMTPTSLFPDGARAIGLTFDALVEALVRSALDRGVRRLTRRHVRGRNPARCAARVETFGLFLCADAQQRDRADDLQDHERDDRPCRSTR